LKKGDLVMKRRNTLQKRSVIENFTLSIVGALVVLGFCVFYGTAIANAQEDLCQSSTQKALKSCRWEAMADYWLATANCDNLSDSEERRDCTREAREELQETLEECNEQYEARLEICEELGSGAYDPEIDPDDFVDIDDIIANPNPYYPLTPGTCRVYEAETEEGTEVIEVCVTDDVREILGVNCVVVRDTVTLDGELIEDTFDWFAQDTEGNVWYFGELSMEFEDGELVSLEGSWEAGEDGAKPGIIMWANPQVGDVFRQEFFLGEAEDMGEILALDQAVTVPYGSFQNCVMTKDYTPIEPDVEENKYYAQGVGVVLEVDVESGERVELIDVVTNGE
jgi:hypothetical protein